MTSRRIVLATPHERYDALQSALEARPEFIVLRLRDRAALTPAKLRAFAPSHVFFPHWSWKIPAEVFEHFECVIFHMTDVPFGRGGSPLQNLVAGGVEQTRLTALRCAAEVDAGPVYLKRPLSTLGTADEVFLRASSLMAPMIVEIVEGHLSPGPQQGEVVSFQRRTPDQGNLSAATSLQQAHNLIRMLDAQGYPHAFVEVAGLRFEFTRASLKHNHLMADVRITRTDDKGCS